MSREIAPLQQSEIPEVSRFLVDGFGAAPDASFAAPALMQWKFFDPRGSLEGPRGHVARNDGRVVGFVGVCSGTWHVAGDSHLGVSTMHMVDWLADKERTNVGAYLFLRAHRGFETAYVLGASDDARRVIAGGGYEKLSNVPVFGRTLRPRHRLNEPGGIGGLARLANDLVESIRHRARAPVAPVALRRVESFGDEVDIVLETCEPGVVFSRRRPDLLNHLLRHPGRLLSGWLIERDGRTLGFAVLSVIPHGKTRIGKIVECFLAGRDRDDWHASITALTSKLKSQNADVALACGSTDWSAAALRSAGYRERYRLAFWLRDKARCLPRDAPFHLTWIEADYAYLA